MKKDERAIRYTDAERGSINICICKFLAYSHMIDSFDLENF